MEWTLKTFNNPWLKTNFPRKASARSQCLWWGQRPEDGFPPPPPIPRRETLGKVFYVKTCFRYKTAVSEEVGGGGGEVEPFHDGSIKPTKYESFPCCSACRIQQWSNNHHASPCMRRSRHRLDRHNVWNEFMRLVRVSIQITRRQSRFGEIWWNLFLESCFCSKTPPVPNEDCCTSDILEGNCLPVHYKLLELPSWEL